MAQCPLFLTMLPSPWNMWDSYSLKPYSKQTPIREKKIVKCIMHFQVLAHFCLLTERSKSIGKQRSHSLLYQIWYQLFSVREAKVSTSHVLSRTLANSLWTLSWSIVDDRPYVQESSQWRTLLYFVPLCPSNRFDLDHKRTLAWPIRCSEKDIGVNWVVRVVRIV